MKRLDFLEKYLPVLLSVLVAVLYLSTVAPTISHTDSGELAATSYTFGIAHPTGYPLFTLLGGIFSHIPFGSPAMMLNLMCLLFVVLSVFFWTKFMQNFFRDLNTKSKSEAGTIRIRMGNLISISLGALLLAFGRTWWMQSTSLEVYSLQCLLLTLSLFTLQRAWQADWNHYRPWMVFAVVIGLCFANHLTAVVLIPGLIFIYVAYCRKHKRASQDLIWALPLLGIGVGVSLLLYAYLPLRAGSDPAYNWGAPDDFASFWHHVSGKQFSIWMFQGKEEFITNLKGLGTRVPQDFGTSGIGALLVWALVVLSAVSSHIYLWKRRSALLMYFNLGVFCNIIWGAGYSIKDPEPYFLFLYLAIAFWLSCAHRWLWLRPGIHKARRIGIAAALGVIVFAGVIVNYSKVNQRGAWQYEDYARACLESLPENAILISKSWDVLIAPAYYLQSCEGFRPDVKIVGYNMLRDRHWFPQQLRAQHPELAASLDPALSNWESVIADFDLRGIEDGPRLSASFNALWSALMVPARAGRPVYISPEMPGTIGGQFPPELMAGIGILPERYLLRLASQTDLQGYSPTDLSPDAIRNLDNYGLEDDILRDQLAAAWRLRGQYEERFGKASNASLLRGKLEALPKVEPFPAPTR